MCLGICINLQPFSFSFPWATAVPFLFHTAEYAAVSFLMTIHIKATEIAADLKGSFDRSCTQAPQSNADQRYFMSF